MFDFVEFGLRLTNAIGVNRAVSAVTSPCGVILMGHSVTSKPAPNDPWAITPEKLDWAIKFLVNRGLKPISTSAIGAHKLQDATPFFCITFDDGYTDNLKNAYPVCSENSVPMTLFVTTGFLQRTDHAWWVLLEKLMQDRNELSFEFDEHVVAAQWSTDEHRQSCYVRWCEMWKAAGYGVRRRAVLSLRERYGNEAIEATEKTFLDESELAQLAEKDDVEIGSHSVTHSNLSLTNSDQLEWELRESAEVIEGTTGIRPATLAYPFGTAREADAREFQAAQQLGYSLAVSTKHGPVYDSNAMHSLPRLGLFEKDTEARMSAKVSGLTSLLKS